MAVSNIKNGTALVIRFEKGTNLDGTPRVVSQKFSSINGAATDAEIYGIGAAIGGILISQPTEIRKVDDYTLSQG